MLVNPAGNRPAAEGICEGGTHPELSLSVSVWVLGVSSTRRTHITLKAFSLIIYQILSGLKSSQLPGGVQSSATGTRWGPVGPARGAFGVTPCHVRQWTSGGVWDSEAVGRSRMLTDACRCFAGAAPAGVLDLKPTPVCTPDPECALARGGRRNAA